MELCNVYTPTEVRNRETVEGLVSAYENGCDVRKVVVVVYSDECHAISGSHRVEAMKRVFGRMEAIEDLEDYIIVVDSNDLDLSCDAIEFLDSVRNGSRDESRLGSLVACLPSEARAAMDDQV